ncbi:MAG: transporter substrate-binding domain-containing protein [Sneathiella sp.]
MYVTRTVFFFVVTIVQMVLFAQLSAANHIATAEVDIVAFTQNSAPKYLDGLGKDYGVCGDIYVLLKKRLLNKNIDFAVSGHLLPIRRILKTLEASSSGIFCGASRDLNSEKLYTYSAKPIYSVLNVLVTSTANKYDPISLEDLTLSNASVGTHFGTSSAEYLKAMGVSRINGKFKSVKLGLKSVAANEIDYFFYHDLGLDYFLSQNTLSLRKVPTIFRSDSHWMIYSKDMSEELQRTVDAELTNLINEGLVNKIRKKYQLPIN